MSVGGVRSPTFVGPKVKFALADNPAERAVETLRDSARIGRQAIRLRTGRVEALWARPLDLRPEAVILDRRGDGPVVFLVAGPRPRDADVVILDECRVNASAPRFVSTLPRLLTTKSHVRGNWVFGEAPPEWRGCVRKAREMKNAIGPRPLVGQAHCATAT